jgi:hypothetical protein
MSILIIKKGVYKMKLIKNLDNLTLTELKSELECIIASQSVIKGNHVIEIQEHIANELKQAILDNTSVNSLDLETALNEFVDLDDLDDLENRFYSHLEDNGYFNIEIVYYGSAMDYLKDNDPSLKRVFEHAVDMGCTLMDLNSESLASILASEDERTVYSFDDNGAIEEVKTIMELLENMEVKGVE